MHVRSKLRAIGVTAACTVLLPAIALAWTNSIDFETSIHGHRFTRASFEGSDCKLRVRVLFSAPQQGYEHAAPARNVYRFHTRIKLHGDRVVTTPVFNNRAPGARAYGFTHDTQAEGCWAKAEPKVMAIDVEGCRGAGCKPEGFK